MSGERVRILVEGRVQGVFFRASTRDRAREIGVTGWVRNRPDGRVEVLAEGARDRLEALVEYCRRGPSHARVTGVGAEYEAATGEFDAFRVVG